MNKTLMEKITKIKTVEDYLIFVKEELEKRVLPEFRTIEVNIPKEMKLNDINGNIYTYTEDDIKDIVKFIQFANEYWKYINNLGDDVIVSFLDKRYKAKVKRISKSRKYKQISSITVVVKIPLEDKEGYTTHTSYVNIIDTHDTFYTLVYKNVPLKELDDILEKFTRFINLLSIYPDRYINELKEILSKIEN